MHACIHTHIVTMKQKRKEEKRKDKLLHNVHRERVLLTTGNYLKIHIHNQDIFEIFLGL